MGTGSFPGVKRPGRGVDHPYIKPRLRKSTDITLLSFWAIVAGCRVNFNLIKPYRSIEHHLTHTVIIVYAVKHNPAAMDKKGPSNTR